MVAMSNSIHTVRWIDQIVDQNWRIHLFPSIDCGTVHPKLRDVVVHHSVYGKKGTKNKNTENLGVPVFFDSAAAVVRSVIKRLVPNYRAIQLKRLVDRIEPDVVHSLEMQNAGYLTLEARRLGKKKFPTWIVTNWGSDIYLFGRLSEHESKIREVLSECDYYSCECHRDVGLARAHGLRGKVLPVFPNTGGFDLRLASSLRQPGQVSGRRHIMLKGYQGWAGRALVGLRALERCADLLKGYNVVIYSGSPDVLIAAELFQKSTHVPVTVFPKEAPHNDILSMHGQARISIGLSISDAISTSLLEALVMGSFPIQSWTACADEWIQDGKTGILVPPEDPEIVEQAIRRALTDDDLVNRSAERNYRVAEERLDQAFLKSKVVELYNTVAQNKGVYNEI